MMTTNATPFPTRWEYGIMSFFTSATACPANQFSAAFFSLKYSSPFKPNIRRVGF